MVTHQAKCNVCKSFPITGLRYHCLKCLNFDLCQVCFFTGQNIKPHKKSHPVVEHCRPVSAKENLKLFFRMIRNNLLPGRCNRKEALRRKVLGMTGNRDFSAPGQTLPAPIQLISSGDLGPSDLKLEHTLELQQSKSSDGQISQAQQKENNSRLLSPEIISSQVLSSVKVELAKTQESINALQNENRYLRKQVSKWKNQVQVLHSAQEERNCALGARFDELIVNQENLKMELQKMGIEIKTLHNKKSLKEKNVQNGSSCPPSKVKHMKYLKYKSLDCSAPSVEQKWFLKEPQTGPLTRNSRSPEASLQSQFFPNTSPEVAHRKKPNGRTVPLTNGSGDQKPEHIGDHLSTRFKTLSSHSSPIMETCLTKRQTEEEELQHLVRKLKDALSFQVQPDQPCDHKNGLLSTAEHVYKSLSSVISQVTLPTREYEGGDTGPFPLLDCPR
ncbi:dystrotelin [Sceloporus undulatus]|uniref:dystrotelin n=1 Tax=Sceloporus undulatus TaxID=8520 RepID=UPI001C4B9918|nr:dystrotelin [Sceloporus undulatus]